MNNSIRPTSIGSLKDGLYLALFAAALAGWLTFLWWGTYGALGHSQGEAGQRAGEGLVEQGLSSGHGTEGSRLVEGGKP